MQSVQRAVLAGVVAGVALVAAPTIAAAGRLEVLSEGAAPFTQRELDEALHLRVDGRHEVTVTVGAGAAVLVTVDGRSRSVALVGERGAAAARVVALVAAALAVEAAGEGRVGAGGRRALDGRFADGSASIEGAVVPGPLARTARPARWTVGMAIDRPYGDQASGGVGAVAGIEGGGWLRPSAAIGFDRRATEIMTFGTDDVSMTAMSLRAGVTLPLDAHGRTAVTATSLARPFVTSGGSGHNGVLVGGGVGARFAVPLPAAATDVLVQAGVDVMANEVEYRWGGATVMTTGRVRPWLVIGVTWERGP